MLISNWFMNPPVRGSHPSGPRGNAGGSSRFAMGPHKEVGDGSVALAFCGVPCVITPPEKSRPHGFESGLPLRISLTHHGYRLQPLQFPLQLAFWRRGDRKISYILQSPVNSGVAAALTGTITTITTNTT